MQTQFKNIFRFIVLLSSNLLFAQVDSLIAKDTYNYKEMPLYKDSLQVKWVKEKYDAMTLDEKIGQLFIVAAYSNKDAAHETEIENLVKNEKIGGLIFMQDQAVRQIELTNRYQAASKVPLLIGIDGEWGLAMRLKDVERFPWNMTFGALSNVELVYETGKNIAFQAQRTGVNFNFAPVVDVNINPKNPIIGNRSYGSDPKNVSDKALAFTKGLQDHNIIASAKHFPGHGDTDKDSHKTLPTVTHSKNELDRIDLVPFKHLIDNGVGSIMVAHLSVPALEPDTKLPSTLSHKIVTQLLKEQLGYKGLIVTDALNMSGVANAYPAGQTDYLAFLAGNDILLFSQAVKTGKQKIIEGIENGSIPLERLEESVKKILMAKYFAGLNNYVPISTANVIQDLNTTANKALTGKIFEQAVTVVKNDGSLLPVKDLINKKTAFVPLEMKDADVFHTYLKKYMPVDLVNISSANQVESLLKEYDLVITAAFLSNETVYKSYKLSDASKSIIQNINKTKDNILVIFGSPYALKDLNTDDSKSVIIAYQNTEDAQKAVPQVIFGALPATGILPVDVNDDLKSGQSIKTKEIQRLGFTIPENAGVNSLELSKIDVIADEAISKGMTPGLQVIAVKDGKVIFDKAYGYHDQERKKKVEWDDLYDIASVTKISATLPLIMQEVSNGSVSLEHTIGDLLPEARNTNKSNLKIKEILAHQAGLKPWIGFYTETVNVKNARLYLDYYSRKQDEEHPTKVTDNIYIIGTIKDTIYNDLYKSPLGAKKYEYSDLGYYFFQEYLEKKYGKSINDLTKEKLYHPIGMHSTTYNPLDLFPAERIVPTEKDKIYRNRLIHGYVHDQGAAMMGGIAGHAGLFSNALDLAKLMQMYLNRGSYGSEQFIKPETIESFAKAQYSGNRRGAGFDRTSGNTKCKCPSDLSYGHTGFTGTMVWVDPKYNIVYVFLSNRVHPDAENKALSNKNIRERIRQQIYDAIVE